MEKTHCAERDVAMSFLDQLGKKLSDAELDDVQRMIDEYRSGK